MAYEYIRYGSGNLTLFKGFVYPYQYIVRPSHRINYNDPYKLNTLTNPQASWIFGFTLLDVSGGWCPCWLLCDVLFPI